MATTKYLARKDQTTSERLAAASAAVMGKVKPSFAIRIYDCRDSDACKQVCDLLNKHYEGSGTDQTFRPHHSETGVVMMHSPKRSISDTNMGMLLNLVRGILLGLSDR